MIKLSSLTLSNIATGVISAGSALIMLAAIPLSENFIDDSKLYSLFLTTIILGVLFAIGVVKRGAIEIILSKLTYAVIGFTLAVTASTFFISPYPVKALLSYGGVCIAAGLMVLFASPLLSKTSKNTWITTFNIATILLIVASFLELIGVGPSRLLPLIPPFAKPAVPVLFNLSGSILNALQLSIIGVVGIFATWLATKRAKPSQLVTVIILLLGILLYGYYLLPGKSNIQLPSFGASWSISLDTVRDPRGALIGAGTGSYQSMYQRFKPFWINGTDKWATVFSAGSSMPLTLLTITGFIGLIAWLAMAGVVFLETRRAKADEAPLLAMLLTTFIVQFFFPPNVVVIVVQAALLALFIAGKRHEYGVLHFSFFHAKVHRVSHNVPLREADPRWPLYLTSGVMLLLLGTATYFLGRFYLASNQALAAVKSYQENDALGVYNHQQRAIALNPFLDLYRRRYAATSTTIADILAQKTDKTAQDTTTISELIQQAVREGQAAITLDPNDAQNYALLASIYQQLIGGVEGSESFAEQYYVQAINLYPSAPELYISLAGIYLRQEKWDQAVRVLNQGLQVKNDFANTWFNLAFALEKLGAYADAKAAYERTLTFVADPNSEDYVTLTKKIEELGKLVEQQKTAQEKQAGQTGNTATPTPTPTPSANPSAVDLNLNNPGQTVPQPDEAVDVNEGTLPEASATPASTPAPAASATPTPTPAP